MACVHKHQRRSLVLQRQRKLPSQRYQSQRMEDRPYFFMAVYSRLEPAGQGVNVALQEQE